MSQRSLSERGRNGHTFDVSIPQCEDEISELKAAAGDTPLKEEDFDHCRMPPAAPATELQASAAAAKAAMDEE